MVKRVFLVVLDSFGLGFAPDEKAFGDEGSNTLASVLSKTNTPLNNLAKMGLFNIVGHQDQRILDYISKFPDLSRPIGAYARLCELSNGKDTTIGHWEMSGIISTDPMPTFPNGFPQEVLEKLSNATGRRILCNKPYSGTKVIEDYGQEHLDTGALIVYTSADSVMQIAAHEDIIPVDELYSICKKAREIMTGKYAVGRIIARPFVGVLGSFTRTSNRHDFSLEAPSATLLDVMKHYSYRVISIGKIKDIFASRGITDAFHTNSNDEGIETLLATMDQDFNGLCFVNLVDFDMVYGHRNDIDGYAKAISTFDSALGKVLDKLLPDDLLIVTADHGCDPSTESTDHSRETVPLMIYGKGYELPSNLGELTGFNNISTIIQNSLMSRVIENRFNPPTLSHKYDSSNLLSYVDMTNLKVDATYEDIEALVNNAIASNAASVCVQPSFVSHASDIASGRLAICTVIGFPNGYSTCATKVFEAKEACDNGASEIDMVVNLTHIKSKRFDYVSKEIAALSNAVHEKGAILKVIIETCFLTEEEKVTLCRIVTEAKADFIKTSTGFGTAGATIEDVKLMKANIGPDVQIKAAGGIRSFELAQEMIDAGANRIGASGLK